jgi:hypothetical protein
VGPRYGLDTETRGKILSLLPGIEPRSPVDTILTELPGSRVFQPQREISYFGPHFLLNI